MLLTLILKLYILIIYKFCSTFYTVKYFICVIFMYTLCKAEISSIDLSQLYVRLQIYNSPFYISDTHSLTMATLCSRNMQLLLQSP